MTLRHDIRGADPVAEWFKVRMVWTANDLTIHSNLPLSAIFYARCETRVSLQPLRPPQAFWEKYEFEQHDSIAGAVDANPPPASFSLWEDKVC